MVKEESWDCRMGGQQGCRRRRGKLMQGLLGCPFAQGRFMEVNMC